MDTSWVHVANLARVAVEIIIVGITTVVFSMDKNDKIVIESLEEWFEFMLSLCESKVDNDEVPIMSKPAALYLNERGNFWGDERHRGSWLTLRAPRGGVENNPPGFSSVVFARGMILKRNFG